MPILGQLDAAMVKASFMGFYFSFSKHLLNAYLVPSLTSEYKYWVENKTLPTVLAHHEYFSDPLASSSVV